jgi:hypothetical protein
MFVDHEDTYAENASSTSVIIDVRRPGEKNVFPQAEVFLNDVNKHQTDTASHDKGNREKPKKLHECFLKAHLEFFLFQ